jgi:ribonuclease J
VDAKDFKTMLDESRNLVAQAIDHSGAQTAEWNFINSKVKDTLEKFYYQYTKRRPMILPFMVKV